MTLNVLSRVNLTRVQQPASTQSKQSFGPVFGLKPEARVSLLPLADQVQAMPMREIRKRLDFMEVRYPNNRYSAKAQQLKDDVLKPSIRSANIFFWNSCLATMMPPLAQVFLIITAVISLYKAIQGYRDYNRQVRSNYQTMLTQCNLPADFAMPAKKSEWKTAVFPVKPNVPAEAK